MNLSWLGRLSPLFARLAGPKTLAALFLFCALPTGLGCAMFTPLAAPPDEPAHVARAEGLRLGQIMNSHVPSSYPAEPICARLFGCSMPPPLAALPDARAEGPSLDQPNSYPGVLIDSGMADLSRCLMRFVDLNHGHVPPSYLTCMRHARWSGQKIAFPTQMVEYFPVFYLPVTFAFWTGKAAGLTPMVSFYLGRMMMLLSYVAMGTAALRLARFGRGLLFMVLLLPTSIFLGASCSQDGQMIAACALAAALLTRATLAAWLVALGLLTAVALAKVSYVPLLLFCLAPLREPGLMRRAGAVLIAAVPSGLWLLHIHKMGFLPWGWPAYHPGPLWPGDRTVWLYDANPAYNISVLRAHPAQIVLLPLHSIVAQWQETWPRILACVSIDWVKIWPWEYPCLAVALAFTALAPTPRARRWAAADAGFALLILFGSFLSIELSLYLSFTPAGAALSSGVQGRYFLPLLPFCIFPLSRIMARLPATAGLFCLPAVAMALINSWALPLFLYQFFRMAWP